MKKFLKISGILVLLVIIVLLASPFLFKDSLEKLLVENINKNINATVAWNDFDLSLFSSFPDAALVITDFSVINKAPFEGDTLASGTSLTLEMGITQLFKSENDAIKIEALLLDNTLLNITVDPLGNANYDIAIKKDTAVVAKETTREESTGFTFDLQQYELKNSRINYTDESTKTALNLSEFNHQGTGDFSASKTNLDTETDAIVSYKIGDIAYLNKNKITLDAVFDMDLVNQKYSFLENELKINKLPLTFDGFVHVNKNNSALDISFKTPSSDFKNFLAMIPEVYVKNLDGVTTTGNFSVHGNLKGIVDDIRIPLMDIKVRSHNASFKYAALPKAVENISINVDLINNTGLVKDTYLNIVDLTFKIDDEIFEVQGSVKNVTENMLVDLALKGTLNLANINKVLPIELDQDVTGIFKADVTTHFDMNSVEKEQYQNINTNGTTSLSNFTYTDAAFPAPIKITNADISMAPGKITLNEMNAATGQTDINAKGSIQNLIPWIMAKQDLKGNFEVASNVFNANDFMTGETKTASTKKTADRTPIPEENSGIKIPNFLDATLNFSAEEFIYDDLTLTNAKGTIAIKDERAQLRNVTSSIFGGDIAMAGTVSTKDATPTFAMDLDLSKVDIDASFSKMPLLSFLAPIAKVIQGNINTNFKINGALSKELTPILETMGGSGYAQIANAQVNGSQSPLISALSSKLSFLNLDKLQLKDIATNFSFKNGTIEVAPFDFDIEEIKITAGGSHRLNNTMEYMLKLDVPAKYMGSEATKLLGTLDPTAANNMTVSLPVGLTGSFKNPEVTLDTKSAVTALSKRIIAKQKGALMDTGTAALNDIINGNGGGDIGDTVGGLLDGIIKPKDTTTTTGNNNTPPKIEEPAKVIKDVLGGLFGRMKKKDSAN